MRETIRSKLEDARHRNTVDLIAALEERKEILYIRRIKYSAKKKELALGIARLLSSLPSPTRSMR